MCIFCIYEGAIMVTICDYKSEINDLIDKKIKPVNKRIRKVIWTHPRKRKSNSAYRK